MIVLARLAPTSLVKASNKFNSNYDLWSVVMIFGEPKRDIHIVKKVFATVSAVMSVSDTASGHLEKRSINVKQYRNPREGGSGPIISK